MKRGRTPSSESFLRRSNRSRKESFKIKLFNATKGKLASAKFVEDMSSPEVSGSDMELFETTKSQDIKTDIKIEVQESMTEGQESMTEVQESMSEGQEPIKEIPVVVPKRKRGRPRKYPLVIKNNPRELLSDAALPHTCSTSIEPMVSDGSNDMTNYTSYGLSDFIDSSNIRSKVLPKSPPKVKPKKAYTYEPILPPCKVCGAKASGYHFGAITCEACKVFFRRSLTRQTSYHCGNNNNCKILSNRRISCSSCRLKKCGELGMSRNGIQRGRYTVERKTECIRKVKELEMLQREKDAEDEYLDEDSLGSPSLDQMAFFSPKLEVDPDMENFIASVVRADSAFLLMDETHIAELLEIQANYLEYLKLKESVFGPMQDLSVDDYKEVYHTTGIDLGNRRQKYAKCVFSFVNKITKFIEFAKALPDFLELSMSDQITLLREAMLDWVLISGYEAFNKEELVFTCCTCKCTWSREEFHLLKDSDFFMQSFVATSTLKKLRLRKDELAILKALALFSPDGSEGSIEDTSFIESCQQRLTESLHVILRRNHPHLSERRLAVLFGKIVHSLTEVRDAGIRYRQMMDQCMGHFPDIEYPDLLMEILGDELKGKLNSARAASIHQSSSLASAINSPSKLSTSSCESGLSYSDASSCEEPVWKPSSSPVIVQPTYAEQLTNSLLLPDSYFENFADPIADDSVDYSIVSSLIEPREEGMDRVLLLAQL